jgi:hypothetical protein
VVLTGIGLGIDPRDLVVNYTNGAVTLMTTHCAVVVSNHELTCVTAPGVGYNFTWNVSVDDAWVRAPAQFTARYNLPVVLDSQREEVPGSADVFWLSGRDFGPAGAILRDTVQRVDGLIHPVLCAGRRRRESSVDRRDRRPAIRGTDGCIRAPDCHGSVLLPITTLRGTGHHRG